MYFGEWVKAPALVGLTFDKIEERGNNEITFICDDGSSYAMYHSQDCCESVTIEDINGDLQDLVGVPILVAEERTSGIMDPVEAVFESLEGQEERYGEEERQWTFYTFRTIKGSVDIRWYGTSTGYYSVDVQITKIQNGRH